MKNSNFQWENIANFIKAESILANIVATIIVGGLSSLVGWWFSLSLVIQTCLFIGILILLLLLMRSIRHKKCLRPPGRDQKINELIDNIKARQSSIIIGIFGVERTFIVDYLRNESNKACNYDKQASQLIFSYLDMGAIKSPDDFDYSKFWEQALFPVYQTITDEEKILYDNSKQSGFDDPFLEQLFKRMTDKEQRLILIIDRFHRIVEFDKLNTPDFFKTIRNYSLHTNSSINLILTIGGLGQLQSLNTQEPGKIYVFNHFKRIILKGFNENEFEEFLRKTIIFSKGLRQQIKGYGITHPHLLVKIIEYLKGTKGTSRLLNYFFSLKKLKIVEDQDDRIGQEIGDYLLNIFTDSAYLYLCETMFSIVKNEVDNINRSAFDELKQQGLVEESNGQRRIKSELIRKFLDEQLRRTGQPCGSGKIK